MTKSFLVTLLLTVSALAASPIDDIKKEYFRSSEGTRLKYLDGVYCIRAEDFQLYNKEGLRLDLTVERSRWEQVLTSALKVSEKVDINSSTLSSDGLQATCLVRYTTTIVQVDKITDKEVSQVLLTDCKDQWSKVGKIWRLKVSRVIEQDYQK